MSSKAFLAELRVRDDGKWSFNWTHSCIPFMLEDLGYKQPFDNGGMALPIVIYRYQLVELKGLDKSLYKDFVGYNEIEKHLSSIEKDMDNQEYQDQDFIVYYCV